MAGISTNAMAASDVQAVVVRELLLPCCVKPSVTAALLCEAICD